MHRLIRGCTVLYLQANYRPAGDAGILAEFGDGIEENVNLRVRVFDFALLNSEFPEVVETVPAYRSLLVLYDPLRSSYSALLEKLKSLEARLPGMRVPAARLVRIPICYGGDNGPDLRTVAKHARLSPDEVIRIHKSANYFVYMIGFTPGFPYLGGMPADIATPRLKRPRLHVPAGSVGIAGSQTGIYPLKSPGGWQIIGRTPMRLFAPGKPDPVELRPGDRVEFYEITAAEFEECPTKEKRECNDFIPIAAKQDEVRTVIRVIRPGVFASVQDTGRRGLLRLGVPTSGAVDMQALTAANLLVGNHADGAVLEIALWGAQFQFINSSVIAVTGGDLEPRLNGDAVPMWQTIMVKAGDLLRFGATRHGCRAYLSFAGGIAVPLVLGSRSTLQLAGIGGLNGRNLIPGDELGVHAPPGKSADRQMRLPGDLIPSHSSPARLRVILGPQDTAFDSDGIKAFLNSRYRVTPASDRMGCRLEGPRIRLSHGADIITDPIPPGAIQVPGDGQPILLLADHQTTGGYAKIAVVISADLDRAGQLKPGDTVCFEAVSLDEAHRAYREYQDRLARMHFYLQNGISG